MRWPFRGRGAGRATGRATAVVLADAEHRAVRAVREGGRDLDPSGDSNFFAEMYQRCRGGDPSAAAYNAETAANPLIDPAYLEAQEAALGPEDFDREFRAAFVSGSAAFIDLERVRACVCDWKETLPADGRSWIASFDPAFSRDPAALAIVGRRHDDPSRLIVGYTQRWLPKGRRLLRRSRGGHGQNRARRLRSRGRVRALRAPLANR